MDGKSLDIKKEKLEALKQIIPEAFTENKVDLEKLKAALGDDIEFKNERYVLNWAGKSDAFRVLQSPTTATLVPAKDESVNFETTRIEQKAGFYLVNDSEIALILEKVDKEIIKAVLAAKPQKVLTLDRLFNNNDPLKTNTALQMKDADIEFKVV